MHLVWSLERIMLILLESDESWCLSFPNVFEGLFFSHWAGHERGKSNAKAALS